MSDELLVVRCQLGERDALAELVRAWHGPLWTYVRRMLGNDRADDVTQEVWVAVLRGLPRLKEPARFAPWLFTIARRRITDQLRQEYGRPEVTSLADVDPRNPDGHQEPGRYKDASRHREAGRDQDPSRYPEAGRDQDPSGHLEAGHDQDPSGHLEAGRDQDPSAYVEAGRHQDATRYLKAGRHQDAGGYQNAGAYENALDRAELVSALAELPVREREVLVLFYLEDFSLDDCAEICGVPVGTVKSRLNRARRLLSEQLTQRGYGNAESG